MYTKLHIIARALLIAVLAVVAKPNEAYADRFTLVIDAGHGGHDSGAKGAHSYEKNINLSVALAFGRYVERNCPDVRIIYTRKTDKFIPLYERAEIANRNKANLFVSVHTNALPGGKISRGFETYTLGDGRSHGKKTNLDVAKRENSVIFMEKDYKQHYVGYDPNSAESNIMFEFVQDHNMLQSVEFAKMLQRNVCQLAGRQDKGVHQDNFAVLRLTSMPACLIELGFITTPDEETALNDAATIDRIGRGIYNAFAEYKNKLSGSITIPYKAEAATEPDPSTQAAPVQDEAAKGTIATQNEPADVMQPTQTHNDRAARRNTGKRPKKRPVIGDDGIIHFDENAGRGKTMASKADSTGAPAKPAKAQKQQPAKAIAQQPAKAKANIQADSKPAAATTADSDAPIFKVQILTSNRLLKDTDSAFKGLTGIGHYKDGSTYKYTVGASANYNEIYRLRKEVVEQFPSCFIIAFKNGERMDVNEAIRLFKASRGKK